MASVKDAAAAAGIAAVLFIPILGLVLDRSGVEPHLWRAAVAVAVVFAGRLAMSRFHLSRRGAPSGAWTRSMAPVTARLRSAWIWLEARPGRSAVLVLAVLGILPFLPVSSNYLIHILSQTFIYILLAMGLNIVVGLAGLLDLGFVAFYAVGAYGYALMAKYWGVSFWVAIPTTAMIAACAGFLLGFPVLRMHGDYLAIVTLGFGEIIRLLLTNLKPITGGPDGINAPRPNLFGLSFVANPPPGTRGFHEFLGIPFSPTQRYIFFYVVILLFTAAAVWIFLRLKHMPIGRAWEALKADKWRRAPPASTLRPPNSGPSCSARLLLVWEGCSSPVWKASSLPCLLRLSSRH
jgi:branched-chain amino acid transport system permease protein